MTILKLLCLNLIQTNEPSFLLSKVRSLKLCPFAILKPLEENPNTVPHLKALISRYSKTSWDVIDVSKNLSLILKSLISRFIAM